MHLQQIPFFSNFDYYVYMKRLFKAKRVNDFDRKMREKYSLSSLSLIAKAAELALDAIREHVKGRKTVILAGGGNNGADGINLLLLMRKEALHADILFISEAKSEENRKLRSLIPESCIVSTLSGHDVIVDAIYGASYHPPLLPAVRAILDEANSLSSFRIALDVPSAYYFKADLTVTFTALKEEQYVPIAQSGEIILCNPGFPSDEIEALKADSYLLEDSDYSAREFLSSDYKNTRGHLLMKAGSPSYKGAALLSARAAFHSGCGLVTLNACAALSDIPLYYPPLIVRTGKVDYSAYQALLAGPGWAECSDRSFLDFPGPMVLDADALSMIERGDDFSYRAILTPHIGEMRRLCMRLCIEEDALSLSEALKAVVIKKASTVEIAAKGERYFYLGNNPSLGVAGSGDVLSGIIGAFLSSGMAPLEAAISAVILHQKCGRTAHERLGYYDALDLIEEVGRKR